MTAEEMFKKAGYEKIDDSINWLTYEFYNGDGDVIFKIEFYKPQQDIVIWASSKEYSTLDVDEIKAIAKQIEELGWK